MTAWALAAQSLPWTRLMLVVLTMGVAVTASGCAGTAKRAGTLHTLSGTTRFQGRPLVSGEVTAMRAEPGGTVLRAPIGADGGFRIGLPPGSYLLMAQGRDPASGSALFSFLANNPVHVYRDMPDAVVLPFVASTAPPRPAAGGGISGTVLLDGEPVPGAVVAAFLDAGSQFHGPAFAESEGTGPTGAFRLNLPPGRYFLLARWRETGTVWQGPLLKGDLFGFYPYNPVVLRTGEGLALDIPVVLVRRPRGEGSLAPGEAIVVEGRVTSEDGRPVPGVRVVLYDLPEMLGRPSFISSPADQEGQYRLEVSRGGTFFAAARSAIGRPPVTGELMGFYEGSEDHSIRLEVGDRVEGMDIVVREVW